MKQQMWGTVQKKMALISPKTWGLLGVITVLGAVLFGWVAFPYILKKAVENRINLAQGQQSRRSWIQLPALDFNVYLFNITNPSEVMRGAKPVVQEVGPYCYKEIKEKFDIDEDSTTDTISYSARTTWYASQQDSTCRAPELTGRELLVVPNVPLLSILILAEKDFPAPFLALVNLALPTLFGSFSDVFLRVSARRLMFDGVLLDCSTPSLLARPVCDALRDNSRALKKLGRDQYSFSFFGAKNGTPEEFRYTVKRGTRDVRDVGRLVALNGKQELPFWRGECNRLRGTDATIFPPFRDKDNGSLTAYSSEICRVIYGVYEGEYDFKGVTGHAYSASLGDTDSNPKDRCYCPAEDRCYKKGVLDAFKCQGAPLVSSLPHFYQSSREYVNGVVGLRPDKDKHGIFIVLEPTSGVPLLARKRIQLNLDLKPVRFTPITQDLRHSLTPLFWAEELMELNDQLMDTLEAFLLRPVRVVEVFKWLSVITGGALVFTAVAVKVRGHRRDRVHILGGDAAGEFGYDQEYKQGLKYLAAEGPTNTIRPFFVGVNETVPDKSRVP